MVVLVAVNEIRFIKTDIKDKNDKPIEQAIKHNRTINLYQVSIVDKVAAGKVDNVRGETTFIKMLDGTEILIDSSYQGFLDMIGDTAGVSLINVSRDE